MAGRGGHPLSPGGVGAGTALSFGLALALASAATVDKYLGLAATALYVIAVTAATVVALPRLDHVRARLSERTAGWLALATLLGLAVLFAFVYPRADSSTLGSGSDRDDAADLAADLLMHGDYPYSGTTYLGNPVSQLPGGVLLAVPFVAIWVSALATFVWLPLFFLMLRRLAGEVRTPLLLAGLVLSVVLALRLPSRGVHGVFAQAAVVQAFFVVAVVAVVVLWSARAGGVELGPLVPGYGLPVALLALGAVASPAVWRGARGPAFVGCAP